MPVNPWMHRLPLVKRSFGDVELQNMKLRVVQESLGVVHALAVDEPPITSRKISFNITSI